MMDGDPISQQRRQRGSLSHSAMPAQRESSIEFAKKAARASQGCGPLEMTFDNAESPSLAAHHDALDDNGGAP
jgi:hypothetical protein